MKNRNAVVAVVGALLMSGVAVRAEEAAPAVVTEPAAKEWSVEAGADYYSQYIWRGFRLSDEATFAPHAVAKWKWFAATYWGYFADNYSVVSDNYYEHDFLLDGTVTLGKFTLTGGGMYYYYPDEVNDGLSTWEIYGAVSYAFPLLNPKLTLNWDVDEFKTGYATASINHPFDLTKYVKLPEPMTLTVTPSASLGISFEKSATPHWNDILLGTSANLVINKYMSVHAGIQYSIALDTVRNAGHGDAFIGNVGITFVY
jgi:hypothetical protein